MEIRDQVQLEKAKLEDTLTEVLYGRYADLVFHGGTAIWRCYSGNRFSRDLDFYLNSKTPEEKMQRYRELPKFLQEFGFSVKEKGYSNSTDTMHFMVELAGTKMKVDVNFRYKKGAPVAYTKVDGSKIVILSLTPLELLNEKIAAYNDKFDNEGGYKHPEAHDLYDMWYLVSLVKKADPTTVKKLKMLVDRIEKTPPVDLASLGPLIFAGLPPSLDLMIKGIREWINDNS